MIQTRINKLFNAIKADVLITLYAFQVWERYPGLTMNDLMRYAGANYEYLTHRLPVFCGRRRAGRNKRVWNHERLLLIRRTTERNNRAVFVYKLSAYGRRWVESLPRSEFYEIVIKLQKKWPRNLLTFNAESYSIGDKGVRV